MNDLNFSIKLEGFDDHIIDVNTAERRINNLEKPLAVISKFMLRNIYTGFGKSTDPYGMEWEEVTELTMRTRKKNKKDERPLIDTGKLRNSFNSFIDQNTLTIGSNHEHADIHQYGGTSESGADIPARMMIPTEDLGLPELWRRKALRELTKYALAEDYDASYQRKWLY